jgi:hypothetical protein
VARIHRQPSSISLTFGGGLGKLKVEGRRMYDGSDSGSQSMAAEAGADNDGVLWNVVDGDKPCVSGDVDD